MKYFIAVGKTTLALEKMVAKYIVKGYIPQGGMVVEASNSYGGTYYYQAMVEDKP